MTRSAPRKPGTYQWLVPTIFLARYELFKIVADIQGSIIECGVLLGGGLLSFAKLSAILEPYNFQRRVIGFDTFTGFSEVDEHDQLGKVGAEVQLPAQGRVFGLGRI